MRRLIITLLGWLLSQPAMAGTICFEKNNSFGIEYPKGYTVDLQAAQRTGSCLAFVPDGTTFSAAPAYILVRIEKLSPEATLIQFVDKDLKGFLSQKIYRIENESDLTTKNNLVFSPRRIFNIAPPSVFNAHAYHMGNQGALVVKLNVKNPSEIPLYEGTYKDLLQEIKKLDEKDIFPFLKSKAEEDINSPLGKNYPMRYLNSILKQTNSALKSCGNKSTISPAVILINERGGLYQWFDEKESPINECLKKKLLNVKGMKAPFEPFHIVLDLKPIK